MSKELDIEVYRKIARTIIRKLYSVKAWGKGHMLIERFKSGLPGHFRGDVDSVVDDLLRAEIIKIYGKTKHCLAVYLNVKKKKEIDEIRKK